MKLTEDQASRISADGLIHDAERLKELQALPLYRKIGISVARIIEWYQYWNGKVYVALSGGKDSTVLLHLVRSIFPDVPAVFSNTGLEYPEIQKFVRSIPNVITVYPKVNFREVITRYGYPLIGKEISEAIYYARRIVPENTGGGGTFRTTMRKRTELHGFRVDTRKPWPRGQTSSDSGKHTGGGYQIQSIRRTGAGRVFSAIKNSSARSQCSTKKSGFRLPVIYLPQSPTIAAMS